MLDVHNLPYRPMRELLAALPKAVLGDPGSFENDDILSACRVMSEVPRGIENRYDGSACNIWSDRNDGTVDDIGLKIAELRLNGNESDLDKYLAAIFDHCKKELCIRTGFNYLRPEMLKRFAGSKGEEVLLNNVLNYELLRRMNLLLEEKAKTGKVNQTLKSELDDMSELVNMSENSRDFFNACFSFAIRNQDSKDVIYLSSVLKEKVLPQLKTLVSNMAVSILAELN